jgi:hypothetical protein
MINGHRWIAATFVVLAIIMALPVRDLARAGYHTGERDRMVQQSVSGTNPPCAMHSGSNDVCPGG